LKGKSVLLTKQKPPEIRRVDMPPPVKTYEIKPKTIRIKVPKHCLADSNIEKEQSLSPGLLNNIWIF
jgi:hypothetical protein